MLFITVDDLQTSSSMVQCQEDHYPPAKQIALLENCEVQKDFPPIANALVKIYNYTIPNIFISI